MPDRTLPLTAESRAVELRGPIPIPTQLWRAWRLARSRPEGWLTPTQQAGLAPWQAIWRGVRADPRRVDRYRVACAHDDDGHLPATWLETLFLDPMAAIVLADAFPLSPLGLIHVGQRIATHRPVRAEETFDIAARLAAVRETARGIELDLALELRVGDELPWTGLTTLLSRNAATRRRTSADQLPQPTPAEESAAWHTETVAAPPDLGRQYARASGDWNPHHLWPLTARVVGYRRPIAHGMWTLGRSLAILEPQLTQPWSAEAAFKRPIHLPGRVDLRWRRESHTIRFEARNPATGEPHLLGSVHCR
jgi:acyl dehydratase